MNKNQIRELIKDVLIKLDLWSQDAEDLIFYTGLYESDYEYIKQIGGPARSFWQIEPFTAVDIFNNYLIYRPSLLLKLKGCCALIIHPDNITEHEAEWLLESNMAFAIAICRLVYLRVPKSIPDNLDEMAIYYKKYYNTENGKGSIDGFIKKATKSS